MIHSPLIVDLAGSGQHDSKTKRAMTALGRFKQFDPYGPSERAAPHLGDITDQAGMLLDRSVR
jgi:hypothetical protein